MIKFTVFKGKDGQFYANMKAGNSETIWQSEGYKRVRNAFKLCDRTWALMSRVVFPAGPIPYTRKSLHP